MAFIGWLVIVVLAAALTFAAVVVFFGSIAWSGGPGLEWLVPAGFACALWILACKFAPFTIVMAGGVP
ncbi:hypothetical protein IDZ74_29455 [Pseudomonas aeruginosa]|uniref:hypothetical protein n=1 Tax=Pseudomonas aeruginosa TaxID=287 RepID=UPI001ADB5973|nr:hypothetical protein [Pseudomonas aeruginosa]MBO8406774.1 hypothetical protein [Pseudomonas aeruginosa]